MALSLYEIIKAIEGKTTKAQWKKQIPAKYHEYLDVFNEKLARELPPHRSYDHNIPLMGGNEPLFSSLFGMSREQLIALKVFIEENLS